MKMLRTFIVACAFVSICFAEEKPKPTADFGEMKGYWGFFDGTWVNTFPRDYVPPEFKNFKIKSSPVNFKREDLGVPIVLEHNANGVVVRLNCNFDQSKIKTTQPQVPDSWGSNILFKKKQFLDLQAVMGESGDSAKDSITVFFVFKLNETLYRMESKGSTRQEAEDAALAAGKEIVEFKKSK